jgi:hypothetical protein
MLLYGEVVVQTLAAGFVVQGTVSLNTFLDSVPIAIGTE